MKKTLTSKDFELLHNANESVRGTIDYMKYHMMHEFKVKNNEGKWSGWKYCSWDSAYSLDEAIVKKVGENVYIMSECADEYGCVDRWKVTPEVNELLKIW